MASWIVGRMICLWSSTRLDSSSGGFETRAERASDSVSEANFACRFCSSTKLDIWSSPRRVSDLQFRNVFSSARSQRCWLVLKGSEE